MAFIYRLGRVRTSSAGNPITFSYEVLHGVAVLELLLNVQSATNRAGGSPTLGSTAFTVRDGVRKAGTSPEASCEVWSFLNPPVGTFTITIPNTGALTIFTTVVEARGGKATTRQTSGAVNNSSANPAPGNVTLNDEGITFAITAGGWQSWAPSAQVGTIIANTDDGATGGGEQYFINYFGQGLDLGWTFGTADDWGAIASAYNHIPNTRLINYQRLRSTGMSIGGIG